MLSCGSDGFSDILCREKLLHLCRCDLDLFSHSSNDSREPTINNDGSLLAHASVRGKMHTQER